MDIQLRKGLLEIGVLASLKGEESYGYKIIADLSPILEISESTLYPILKRLEANGFIQARTVEFGGRLRKYYRITGDGQIRLLDYLADLKSMRKVADYIMAKIY